jgi:hypothetical protein
MRDGVLRRHEQPEHIGVHNGMEVRFVDVRERRYSNTPALFTRVLISLKCPGRAGDHRLHIRRLREIALNRDRPATRSLYVCNNTLCSFHVAHIANGDPRARRAECSGDARTNPLGGAGNQGDLPRQIAVHREAFAFSVAARLVGRAEAHAASPSTMNTR